MSGYETIRYEAQGRRATITLARPDRLNSITNTMLRELYDCVRRVADDPEVRVVKLTGAGSGGCVCIFVGEGDAEAMCRYLDDAYYGVPAHFDRYREELRTITDERTRREMERNLEEGLASAEAQRRIVSFSRGAGVIRAYCSHH